jgi:dienelactone hydrolase
MSLAGAVRITVPGGVSVEGDLVSPQRPVGAVVFAHGSGSSRFSPRNRMVASVLNGRGFATLLLDLLTAEEERVDIATRQLRFNVEMLAERLTAAADYVVASTGLAVGYFGASTGAGAALIAAADKPEHIRAVVSRGGRPDLAGQRLHAVTAPTLLVCGGNDPVVIDINRWALGMLTQTRAELRIVPGATHLFEEPGALDEVGALAADWFAECFGGGAGQ